MAYRLTAHAYLSATLLAILLPGDDSSAQSSAQVPFGTLCQTEFGICPTPAGPVGSYCQCNRDPGRIIFPPSNWNNACRTYRGVCGLPNYQPIGSQCNCGNDAGQVMPR